MTGTEWDVDSIAKVTDGDTLRVIRSRIEHMGDHDFRIADVESMPIRLVWVDTPERGDHPGWEQARADLISWCATHTGLRVICYQSAGWDRILGDLVDSNGESASQWMMTQQGWPPYVAS